MEALYKINGSITVKVEAENTTGLVEKLTEIRESIGYEPCGKCDSSNTFPNSRRVNKDTYYDIRCADCNSALNLGVNKEEKSLYKKRLKTDDKGISVKDKNDKVIYLPNKGWRKWNPETKTME